MIRAGFLDRESRRDLIELARNGSAAHRLARRANALVLLDDGMSCDAIAKVLLLDDDTIRTWYRLYEEDGIEGLTNFGYEGSACQLRGEQQEKLKGRVTAALLRYDAPKSAPGSRMNSACCLRACRSGLIALLHRLGLEHHKPNVIPRKLDEEKQKAFIEELRKAAEFLGGRRGRAVCGRRASGPMPREVACRLPGAEPREACTEQTSGRQRIQHSRRDRPGDRANPMIEALTIDAASTSRLLQSIEALHPMLALIHVFLDNARYHHAKLVQEWMAWAGMTHQPLHFILTYCPQFLNPNEGAAGPHAQKRHAIISATQLALNSPMRRSVFCAKVSGNWADLCDSVTDNFRVINPKDFRVMT